jgi:1,4-alpha-glucan branching enzyme
VKQKFCQKQRENAKTPNDTSNVKSMHRIATTNSLKVIEDDPYLNPYKSVFDHRFAIYKNWIHKIDEFEGGIDQFTRGYQNLGMNVSDKEFVYREWAPGVTAAYLVGDFSKFEYLIL